MYGSHTRGLEFGKVEAKFVLHTRKGGCGQAVASDVVRVDWRKLRDAGLGGGLRSSRTTAGQERNGHYTNVTAFFIQLLKFLKEGNKSDSMALISF